jgi:hypothetical protein
VIRCNDIALFFQTLRERKQNRDKLAAGHIPSLQETQKQPLATVITFQAKYEPINEIKFFS